MQKQVDSFIRAHNMGCGETARYLDLVSEIGELGKELLKGSDYGHRAYTPREEATGELGDCLFSLLALCSAMGVDAQTALNQALDKYRARLDATGSAGSGK